MASTRAVLLACAFALALGACRTETTSTQAADAGRSDAHDDATDGSPDAHDDATVSRGPLCGPSEGGPQPVDPTSLPQCTFDPSVGSVDASVTACRVARMFVTCGGSQGCALCLSDDGTCPDATVPQVDGGAASFDRASCASECAPTEYAVECGGAKVPTGCRSKGGPTPGGGFLWSCCPCR